MSSAAAMARRADGDPGPQEPGWADDDPGIHHRSGTPPIGRDDPEAEECIAGLILSGGRAAFARLEAAGITTDSFNRPAPRAVWVAAADVYAAGNEINHQVVENELKRKGELEAIGGPQIVLSIWAASPLASGVDYFVDGLLRFTARRRLEIALREGHDALVAGRDPGEVADRVRSATADLHGSADAHALTLRAGLLSIDQLAGLPQPDPLIEDVLWSNTLACIFGKPGSAKTFVALDWALSIATGTRWQGIHVTQAAVLWVAAEGAEGLHKRIWAWQVEHQTHVISEQQLVVYPQPVNLFDPKQAAALARLVAEQGYGLVVIDTLARSSLGAEENSAKDMGQVVEAAESIRRASAAAVLLVHHTARNGDSPRGSSAIDGATYTLWKTELEGDEVKVTNEKAKETARTSSLRLQLVPRLDSVVLHRATPSAEGLTEGPRQMLRLLAEIADENGIPDGVWKRSCEKDAIAERSFYRWKKDLEAQGFTANVGTGKAKRWVLTDLGQQAAEAT